MKPALSPTPDEGELMIVRCPDCRANYEINRPQGLEGRVKVRALKTQELSLPCLVKPSGGCWISKSTASHVQLCPENGPGDALGDHAHARGGAGTG